MQIVPTLSLVALATALATSSSLLRAQQSNTSRTARLTLAVVDSMPIATARAMVVRKPNGRTVLVLDRKHATPETLGLGLAVLKQVTRRPHTPGAQQVIPIQGGVATKAPSARRVAFLRKQLNTLYAKQPTTLGGLGRGKFMELSDRDLGR
jgi:type IV secretory pathway protease TraF